MTDDGRLRQLEIALATLRGDLAGHIALCEGRWRVARMLTAAMSGAIALAVSSIVVFLTRT